MHEIHENVHAMAIAAHFPCFYLSNHVSFYPKRSSDSRFVTDLALEGLFDCFYFLSGGRGKKDSRSIAYFKLLSTGLKKKTMGLAQVIAC